MKLFQIKDFESVFYNYGAKKLNQDTQIENKSLENFPFQNFSLVIQLMDLCLLYRLKKKMALFVLFINVIFFGKKFRGHEFDQEDRGKIFSWICKFLIDPLFRNRKIDFLAYFEAILNHLFQQIEESNWKEVAKDFKNRILQITTTPFKIVTILQHIPRISLRARQFQAFMGFHTLSVVTKKKVFFFLFFF